MPTVTSYPGCLCCASSSSSSQSSSSTSSSSGGECCPGLAGSTLHVSLQAGPGCHCADEINFTCPYDGQTASGTFVLCDLGEVTLRVECDEPHWTVTATSETFGESSVSVMNAATCPGLFLSEELGIGGCNFIFVVTA